MCVCMHVQTERFYVKSVLLWSPNSCPISTNANQEKFHLTKLTYTNGEKAQIKSESQSRFPKDLYKLQWARNHFTSVLSIWFY